MMNEYEKRKQAISRYQAGEKVTHIVAELGKSRRWFYNWLARWKDHKGPGDWFADRSRAPKTKPSKVAASLEQRVIDVRRQLERKGIAQTGAIAITYALRRQGVDPPPVWTINRILARHGLTKDKPIRRSNKDYPEGFIHTHQMDLVGPRWIKGDGRYSVNIIDTCSRMCTGWPVRTKASCPDPCRLLGPPWDARCAADGQRAGVPRKQPLPAKFWHRRALCPGFRYCTGIYSDRRTLAQWDHRTL